MITIKPSPAWIVAFLLVLHVSLPAVAALPAKVDNQPLPTLAPMLERATPAVVNIATESRVANRRSPLLDDPFFRHFFNIPQQPRERRAQSLGSGVVVDAAQGYVVTNHHVINKADTITVILRDGRRLEAKLIGSDPETDVAVIQVPAERLTELPLADSDALRVGDFVVAIGNPFGLGQTVTSGIVSALGRTGLGIQGYEDFIQTDASINPGNSGGALVNLHGELVGINTAIIAPGGGNVGIGFAIPANMVKGLMAQLVSYGEIQRGQLGVVIQDLTEELARAFNIRQTSGAVIAQIMPDSAAQRAGLRAGDVILAVDGKPVRGAGELRNRVGLLRIGEQVKLNIIRDGRRMTITAKISKFQASTTSGKDISPRLAGAVFQEIVPGSPLFGRIEGVLVAQIEPGSPAARAGLRGNDIVFSINQQSVADTDTLERVAAQSDVLLIGIQRGRSQLALYIQ
ncbi:MAG: DegQ family serine endoprotease [Candidatus Competibacteraceae bacterium]|jgi:serine protease Do/serine protease DegQ|nr:DegQ family serine endoprotease [Candidatus Competibacteraceae bacterium]